MTICITVTGFFADEQAKTLAFYTDKLGFVVKNDVPLGEHRWLTVDGPGDHRDARRHLRQSHPARQPGLSAAGAPAPHSTRMLPVAGCSCGIRSRS